MAAVIACEAAASGRKVLVVAENDLKAMRLADDVRQLTFGEGSCLPGGEIDLTRAAGSLENSWRRLEALCAVSEGKVKILCAGAEAMAQRMGRPEPFRALCLRLKAGDVCPPAELTRRLSKMGYDRVEMVEGKGQFARRGSILDVYPPALSQGLRIELFDDEIDGIRTFDCISQRSMGEAEEAVLTPAAEALLDEEEYAGAAERMREAIGMMPGGGQPGEQLAAAGSAERGDHREGEGPVRRGGSHGPADGPAGTVPEAVPDPEGGGCDPAGGAGAETEPHGLRSGGHGGRQRPVCPAGRDPGRIPSGPEPGPEAGILRRRDRRDPGV